MPVRFRPLAPLIGNHHDISWIRNTSNHSGRGYHALKQISSAARS